MLLLPLLPLLLLRSLLVTLRPAAPQLPASRATRRRPASAPPMAPTCCCRRLAAAFMAPSAPPIQPRFSLKLNGTALMPPRPSPLHRRPQRSGVHRCSRLRRRTRRPRQPRNRRRLCRCNSIFPASRRPLLLCACCTCRRCRRGCPAPRKQVAEAYTSPAPAPHRWTPPVPVAPPSPASTLSCSFHSARGTHRGVADRPGEIDRAAAAFSNLSAPPALVVVGWAAAVSMGTGKGRAQTGSAAGRTPDAAATRNSTPVGALHAGGPQQYLGGAAGGGAAAA